MWQDDLAAKINRSKVALDEFSTLGSLMSCGCLKWHTHGLQDCLSHHATRPGRTKGPEHRRIESWNRSGLSPNLRDPDNT